MEHTDDIELLAGVVTKTGDLIAGVTPDQADRPTPCPDYDVATLVNHLCGWIRVFAAGVQGKPYEGDPGAHEAGPDPAAEFRAAAADLVDGWRARGFDGAVSLTGAGEVPARMALNMTLMEYLTHGWDLAVATGQPVPFTEAEAEETLARAEQTLPPQYRGEGMPFGDAVPVEGDAPAVDRLVGFMGREPRPA
ncbi:MAG TPA: TIGR03086 family metal-binding protein [Acidimicrobiales bacterium]|nr:TIGR03086 family metal-binding protein [Acidimicrobiales bacterium]